MHLSIITISKDDPNGLSDTLTSTQDIGSIEQIVVLGGDHSRISVDIAKPFNCTSIQQLDQGISAAFNLGLAQATGLGVMFLNGGDILLEPALISHALDWLDQHPDIDILLYDAIFDDALTGPYRYRAQGFYGPRLNRIGLGMPGSHQAMVVRRSSFAQVGAFNPEYQVAMDYDWLCRWHKISVSTRCVYSVDFPPVVQVDGKGISISREPLCLYECFWVLRRNGLFKGRYAVDYLNRLLRFCTRYTMMKLRLNSLVAKIKQWKHQ
ncbi:glycosyltransferase [Nodosilinea sp. LEGE 07088]|uniref:glycosyltransferase n=1 Tax=Nodosilinea sp. LEGE 07088 TaxID=2777968 RepID=UPI0018812D8C|nr:glycosyltransferase [Nodosilinea sp. LEGE 07088]MBE9136019.1 glycosyltransferase [Nodosilinea sp. LEGE 07088]